MGIPTLPAIAMRPGGVNSFESETQAVLSDLRNALAAIVGQFRPGVLRGADLKRLLGLDAKLSWSVFTAATADDLHTLVTVLPGARAMGRFFEAAAAHGVTDEDVARAKTAFDRFEYTVRTHAADRDVFDAMVSSLSASNDDIIDERLRKRLFIDHSIFWGIRCKASYLCFIERPSAQPQMTDSAMVLGCLQLQQLREGHALNLETETAFGGAADPAKLRDHLSSATGVGERSPLTLLEEFCSGPLPQLTAEGSGLSGDRTAMRFSGLGRAAAVDLVMAQTSRAAEMFQGGTNSVYAVLTCPSEVSYCDFLLPAGESDPRSARARAFASRINAARVYERRPEDQIPMKVSVAHCGRVRFPLATEHERTFAKSPLAMPESPQYPEVLNHMVERLGWADLEYDAYRCFIRYPVMQTLVEVAVDQSLESKNAARPPR